MCWTLTIAGTKVTVDNPSPADTGRFLNFMRKNSRMFNDIYARAGL